METGTVYKATNKTNGKLYIGQTTEDPKKRKYKHRFDAKVGDSHFKRALRKYGIDGFRWTVLCKVSAPTKLLVKLHLDTAEQMFIEQYDSMNRSTGYNCTIGGGGSVGFKHKKSSRQKMSVAHTGLKNPNYPAHPKPKPPMSDETREKIRQAKLGSKNPMYGVHKPRSEETKQKMSESMKRTWARKGILTPEERVIHNRENQRRYRQKSKGGDL